MKVSIIVEARLGSKRLQNKILYKIKKKTFFEYLINNLKYLKNADEIIVATTLNKKDDKIANIAKKNKIKFYRGSETNVLKRVIDAGKKYRCNIIARVTSDCPLIDIKIIDKAILMFKKKKCDYLSNVNLRTFPDGMDIEIFTLKTLIKSYKYATDKRSKEWITWSIRKKPKIFNHVNLKAPKNIYWPELGLTLDEINDVKFLRKILIYFKEKYKISCLQIINVLKKKNYWLKINQDVKRN